MFSKMFFSPFWQLIEARKNITAHGKNKNNDDQKTK